MILVFLLSPLVGSNLPLKGLLLYCLKGSALQSLQLQQLRQMHGVGLLQLTLIHVLKRVSHAKCIWKDTFYTLKSNTFRIIICYTGVFCTLVITIGNLERTIFIFFVYNSSKTT